MIEVTYIDHMGNDLSVVNAARVSFGKKSEWEVDYDQVPCGLEMLSNRDAKLINYLAKHKHISPFGHCFASFHIKAPIFVARQLVKHKFLRWNEISRRYVDDVPEFYEPDVWRGRSADKKQGSDGVVELHPMTFVVDPNDDHLELNEASLDVYNYMLHQGVAPEQARMVLPQSTMTEWYWSGSLDAFADMCNLRCKSDTQAETRQVAQQIDRKMIELFPVSWDALTEKKLEELKAAFDAARASYYAASAARDANAASAAVDAAWAAYEAELKTQ
jgi:thymidylate synthase (FAD)